MVYNLESWGMVHKILKKSFLKNFQKSLIKVANDYQVSGFIALASIFTKIRYFKGFTHLKTLQLVLLFSPQNPLFHKDTSAEPFLNIHHHWTIYSSRL